MVLLNQSRKNAISTVYIVGLGLSWLNPVHFVHLSDGSTNEAHDETDAALDHYVYHPNTAFQTGRQIQEMVVTNRVVDDFLQTQKFISLQSTLLILQERERTEHKNIKKEDSGCGHAFELDQNQQNTRVSSVANSISTVQGGDTFEGLR